MSLPDAAIAASLRHAGLSDTRAALTFDSATAYGLPPTTGFTDDPINTASGNFVFQEDDLAFGGLLERLLLARTYNSRSPHVGAFGRGGSSWADAHLIAPRTARSTRVRTGNARCSAAGARVTTG